MQAALPRFDPVGLSAGKITHRYTKEQYPQDIYRQVIVSDNSEMDRVEEKYERRRRNLIKLRDERCGGKAAELASVLGRSPNYVSRMLYEPSKEGRKRIAEDMVDLIEEKFGLPRGWLDDLTEAVDDRKNEIPVIDMQYYATEEDERRLLVAFRGLPQIGGARLRVMAALADEVAGVKPVSVHDPTHQEAAGGRDAAHRKTRS